MSWEKIRCAHPVGGPQDPETWAAVKDAVEFVNWMTGIPIKDQDSLLQALLRTAREKMEAINKATKHGL